MTSKQIARRARRLDNVRVKREALVAQCHFLHIPARLDSMTEWVSVPKQGPGRMRKDGTPVPYRLLIVRRNKEGREESATAMVRRGPTTMGFMRRALRARGIKPVV